jgi:hypothetical protein
MGAQASLVGDRIRSLFPLALVLIWLLNATITGDSFFMMDVAYLSLAFLGILLGILQQLARPTQALQIVSSILYSLGTAVFLLSYVWRHRTGGSWQPEVVLWLVDVVTPAMLLLGVALTFFGVLRWNEGGSDLSKRIYMLGGLVLCLGVVLQLWYGAVTQWSVPPQDGWRDFGVTSSLDFSYPIALVFSLGAVCLGLLPTEVRPGVVSAGSYLAGCVLLVVGAFVQVAPLEWYGSDFFILGAALLIPSFLFAGVRMVVPNRGSDRSARVV